MLSNITKAKYDLKKKKYKMKNMDLNKKQRD